MSNSAKTNEQFNVIEMGPTLYSVVWCMSFWYGFCGAYVDQIKNFITFANVVGRMLCIHPCLSVCLSVCLFVC